MHVAILHFKIIDPYKLVLTTCNHVYTHSMAHITLLTLPQLLQWCLLFFQENLSLQLEQLGESASGTQLGWCSDAKVTVAKLNPTVNEKPNECKTSVLFQVSKLSMYFFHFAVHYNTIRTL